MISINLCCSGTTLKWVAIAVEVYDNNGQKITRRKQGRLVATNPSGYIFRYCIDRLCVS